MPRPISESVVAITGASSGIGRATARRFADQGATLVVGARRESALEQLAEECRRAGSHIRVVPTDVTDEEAVDQMARTAIVQFGRLDVWVNNAGVTLFGRIEEVPMASFRQVIETNLLGYVHGARAAIPYFREQGSGVLINNASALAKGGAPYLSADVASKTGIVGLADSLRQEVRGVEDLHVCTVLPGSVDTPLFRHAGNYTGRAVKPLEPMYSADEVAEAITGLVEQPERETYVGYAGRAQGALRAVAPNIYEKRRARKVVSEHFQPSTTEPSDGNLFEPAPRWTSVSGGWRGARRRKSPTRWRAAGVAAVALAAGAWSVWALVDGMS
ncbi:MAG: SDR family oxidoreductase [Bradymonadaceae bacterium]